MSKWKDRGHYYLNRVLMEGMTMAQCRDAGGLPSVTTKISSWLDDGIVFWKIDENVEAAYNCIDRAVSISASLDEFRKMVADEFYRVHTELIVGDMVHDIMDKLIKNAVKLEHFSQFFPEYAAPMIREIPLSIKAAYAWFLDNTDQAASEKLIYNEASGIAGTADVSGMVRDESGNLAVGGVDWKSKFIKKHPGFKKDNTMRAFQVRKNPQHVMQLGAYGKEEGWNHGWVVIISTNPDVQGIKPMFYDQAALAKGYKIYAHTARAYDIQNGFRDA